MAQRKTGPARPRTPGRPRAAEGLDTREVLMRAGLQLFAARGYAGVAVGEIAEAAGLSTPVIYQRFGSKAGLFVAVAEDCYARGLDHLRPRMTDIDTIEEAIDAIFTGFASLYRIDRDICRMVLTVLVEVNRDAELGEQLSTTLRTFRSFFDGVADMAPPEIAPDQSARRDLSRALVAVASGLTSAAVMMPDADDYDRMVDMMRSVILARLDARR